MKSAFRGVARCVVAGASSLAALACTDAGSEGDPTGQEDAQGEAKDVDASAPAASSTECIEKITQGTTYARQTRTLLDANLRVVTQFDDEGNKVFAWRYDEAKRLLAFAGFRSPAGTQYNEFQHDYAYDANGMIVDFHLSYPPASNVDVVSGAPVWMGHQRAHSYSETGALLASVETLYGEGNPPNAPPEELRFHENELGQCDRIERVQPAGSPYTQTRAYDDAGRLARIDVTGTGPWTAAGAFRACNTTTIIWTYDAQGRTKLKQTWCNGGPDQLPGQTETTQYDADGIQRVELIDRLTDVSPGTPILTERSAYCAVIDAWRGGPRDLPHPTTTRCVN